MSSKIPLYFHTEESADGKLSIRLYAWIALKSLDGYTAAMVAIADIGAPVSLFPFRAWGQSAVTLGESSTIPSISGRPECDLDVFHGKITFSVLDEEGQEIIKDLTIEADLCHTSELPILLGMHHFLSLGRLVMDYPTGEAWLQLQERNDEQAPVSGKVG
ncbi:MAG: hypothetical protein ACPGWR_20265 [Ardenticatenaceae bacterium]